MWDWLAIERLKHDKMLAIGLGPAENLGDVRIFERCYGRSLLLRLAELIGIAGKCARKRIEQGRLTRLCMHDAEQPSQATVGNTIRDSVVADYQRSASTTQH
jgi:hypothetical protein